MRFSWGNLHDQYWSIELCWTNSNPKRKYDSKSHENRGKFNFWNKKELTSKRNVSWRKSISGVFWVVISSASCGQRFLNEFKLRRVQWHQLTADSSRGRQWTKWRMNLAILTRLKIPTKTQERRFEEFGTWFKKQQLGNRQKFSCTKEIALWLRWLIGLRSFLRNRAHSLEFLAQRWFNFRSLCVGNSKLCGLFELL